MWILIALTNKCTKYELHLTSEFKVSDRCSCCHGNKVSIATRPYVNSYCPNEQMYQHLTSEFKVSDRCSCCHGNKVSIATRPYVNSY